MPIDPNAIGATTSPHLVEWTDRDTLLYALGVGAGIDDLAFTTENKLQDDGSKMGVELKVNSIEDFEPDNIVQQVDPLRKLVEARQKLSDLLSKMDGNDKLEALLQEVVSNTEALKTLSDETGRAGQHEEASR